MTRAVPSSGSAGWHRDDRRGFGASRVRSPEIDRALRREHGATIERPRSSPRRRRTAPPDPRYPRSREPRSAAPGGTRRRRPSQDTRRPVRSLRSRPRGRSRDRARTTLRSKSGRIHALTIDRIAPREIGDQRAHEGDVVRPDVLRTAIVPAAPDTVGVRDDEAEFVTQRVELRELLLTRTRREVPVKRQHERDARRDVRGHVQKVGSMDARYEQRSGDVRRSARRRRRRRLSDGERRREYRNECDRTAPACSHTPAT